MASKWRRPRSLGEIFNQTLDEVYRILKFAPYGWDGSKMVQLKVNSNGEIVTAPATDFEGGPVTVGTTAVEVTFSGQPKAIQITADHDNSGTIYVGKSNVLSDGTNAVDRLEAGETLEIEFDDSSTAIYVVASEANQKIYKLALL